MTQTGPEARGDHSPIGVTQRRLGRMGCILFVCLVGACRPNPIMRVRDGRTFEERAIVPEAYAAFLRGKLFEQEGDKTRAANQYRTVLSKDPEAQQAMVRLGAIYCTESATESTTWFTRAEQLDSESPSVWLERAQCELTHGRLETALLHAQRSLRYQPTSERALRIVVAAASQLHRLDSGLAWLRAAVASEPNDVRLWKLLFENENAERAERLYAASQLSRLQTRDSSDIPRKFQSGFVQGTPASQADAAVLEAKLADALSRNDVDSARSLATRLGVNPEQLALLAWNFGSYSVASAQVELLLAVDPDNSTLWALGVLAADYQRESTHFSVLLARPPIRPLPDDSPLRKSILDLLTRRAAFEAPGSTRADPEATNSRPE